MNGRYDIIVVGAGLVGTGLVAALKNTSLNMAILETHLPVQIFEGADNRPLTLSYSSQKILETLGLWKELSECAEPIHAVHISEQNQFGTLCFRASEENVSALGYVVPVGVLQNLLYRQAAENNRVHFISIQKLTHIKNDEGKVWVTAQTIDGEKTLEAELLVAADGAHSPTRALLGIHADEKQNDDAALIVTVELAKPHQHTAYERFTQNGIVAVLPLKNPQHCRIVWTLPRTFSEEVLHWPDAELAEYLRAALQNRLGNWRVLAREKPFPLEMVWVQKQICPGVVLLGNAAHTLYPLAAQGFNLGLHDAATLAELLVDAQAKKKRLGNEDTLKSYLDWRLADQHWVTRLTYGASQLFELHAPGLGILRGAGLLAMDLIPPFKHRLARRFMGMSGKCPKLTRGIAL